MPKKNNQEKPPLRKRIASFFKRKLSATTVRVSQKPVLFTILALVMLNLIVLFVATAIANSISDFQNFGWALVTVATWLVAPNSVLTHGDNMGMMILNVIVLITGMILFTGTIIAIITTYLRNYINRKSDAKGNLILTEHLVILNYNQKVTAMLVDLSFSKTDKTVLLLSEKDKDFIKAKLAAEIAILEKKPPNKLKLLIRQGNPNSIAELEEISLEKASGVLIVEPEKIDHDLSCIGISSSTYSTIKLIMKLAHLKIPASCPIAIEADRLETAKTLHELNRNVPNLKDKDIRAFSYNRKLGQFMALSILCPEISRVLTNLLSYTGAIFQTTDLSIDEFLKTRAGGIPIVQHGKTFVLTAPDADVEKKLATPFGCEGRLSLLEKTDAEPPLNLYIIGKNKKFDYMLGSLKASNREVRVKAFSTLQKKEFVSRVIEDPDENTIALILSDDEVNEACVDINVFETLIEFSKSVDLENRKFKIIAELLDPDNQRGIEEFSVKNIIISTKIISFFATKLLGEREVERFYEDIFTHSIDEAKYKFGIWVDKANELFKFNANDCFEYKSAREFICAAYYGSFKKVMPLGILLDDKTIKYFTDDLDNTPFVLDKNATIIYAKY